MIKEAYCSAKVAELLHKNLVDIPYSSYVSKHNDDGTSELISTPTHQSAMAWLREKHKIFIEIRICFMPKVSYRADILEFNDLTDIQWLDDLDKLPMKETYEEAVEEALLYTLKKNDIK